MGIDKILETGFANCRTCNEPLRSIGLVDVIRSTLEKSVDSIVTPTNGTELGIENFCGPIIGFRPNRQNQQLGSRDIMEIKNLSLLQEAEDSLARAIKEEENGNNQKAISEYTHAINAVNYLTSSSNGSQLVLRAHDIFLIAHAHRADLEGNSLHP